MKTLKDLSLTISEQEYHDLPYWSYSVIKKYAKDGFTSLPFLTKKTEPNAAMEFGSLFDSIMTKGKRTLDEYAVMDVTVPPAERKALDFIVTSTQEHFDDIPKDTINTLCIQCQYYPKWGVDAKLDHLALFKDYYEIRLSGKKIVSKEDWNDAMDMYHVFRQDEYLSKLFGTKSNKDVEYIYQAKFVTDWTIGDETVKVKVMPDLIVVNHKDKTIQPVDLKTSTDSAIKFKENFIQMHYYLQAELYTDVIRKLIDEQLQDTYGDYTILPYLFTDISRTDKVPVTYVYDPTNGFSFCKNDRFYSYKGWKELLAEILYYQKTQAKVPSYINASGPNDLIELLSQNV